jgi:hypothetical protein
MMAEQIGSKLEKDVLLLIIILIKYYFEYFISLRQAGVNFNNPLANQQNALAQS